ncbi:MAG TPA: hypothetical protein VKV26_07440 [Dehalococcoidia bacterium]|nr:hypothetical protein [Dehalococcoidia bacterium]
MRFPTTFPRKAPLLIGLAAAAIVAGAAPAAAKDRDTHHLLFVTSAHENHDFTEVTYPLHTGSSHGKTVYYVITDASDRGVAALLGVNYVPKLANAKGTAAVQLASVQGFVGNIDFPATVDFSPQHVIQPGPAGFPPAQAQPGAVGEAGYSPLIQLPDGTVINAPQIANDSGRADKVIRMDLDARTVTYVETTGFYDRTPVHYASFDSSDAGAAAIEDVTYAPNLNAAPALGNEDDSSSAREGLVAFTNGITDRNSPELQGINAALLDGLPSSKAPLNILHEVPEQSFLTTGQVDYSPLWDIHLTTWTQAVVDAGQNLRQTDFDDVLQLVQQGKVTGFPAGTPFRASGFIVNCPVVSREVPN